MKKIIILENNGGRLANQLWQYAVIYSFCIENGCSLDNYCFFSYNNYFNISNPKNIFVKYLFFDFYRFHKNIVVNKILYLFFVSIIKFIYSKKIIKPKDNVFLSGKIFNKYKEANNLTLYFCGWNFRNPLGLTKYHSDIVKLFRPKEELIEFIDKKIAEIRSGCDKIVGVHVRHGDYKIFNNGKYYFEFQEVRLILDDFLKTNKARNIFFFICSDDDIPDEVFRGLNYVKGFNHPIKDLYALSLTDLIISSESTFSQWASYYGNINNINFSREKIDWTSAFIFNKNNNPWLVNI